MIFSLPNSRYIQKMKPIAVTKMPFAIEVVTTTTESMTPVVKSVAFSMRADQLIDSELICSCVMFHSRSSRVASSERRMK